MISFNDLSDSEKDDLKGRYQLDEEYELSVSEVNTSMKKIFFASNDAGQKESSESDKD